MKTSSKEIVVLNLINKHYNPVNIYWLGGSGERLYSTLKTGESYKQGSYKDDEWLFKDQESDEPLMTLKAAESTDVTIVGENRPSNLKANVSKDIDIVYKRPVIEKQYALDFDGDNDVVIIPAGNNFSLDNKWTLEAWVYRRRKDKRDPIIDKSGNHGGTGSNNWGGLTLQIGANNKLQAGIITQNRSFIYGEGEVELEPRRWYHVAASFDGDRWNDEIECFINGQPVTTTIKYALDIMDSRPVLSFDGKNDYLTVPDHSALRISAYTVELWIKPEKTTQGWQGIIGKPGRNFNIWLHSNGDGNGYIHHRFKNTASTNSGAPDTPSGLVKWHEWNHIAITNDGTSAKTYINGKLQANGSSGGAQIVSNSALYMGRNLDGNNDSHFEGEMAEIRIWNKARSEDQIKDCMTRLVPENTADLAAYWRCDEGHAAQSIKDYSVNNLNINLREPVNTFDISCSPLAGNLWGLSYYNQMTVSHNDKFNFTKSFTLEAWVYLGGGEGKSGDFFIVKPDAWTLEIFKDPLTKNRGCLAFWYRHREGTDDGAWDGAWNEDVPLNGRGWTHVAVACYRTESKQKMYMYIDGNAHQVDVPKPFYTNSNNIYIGNDSNTGTMMRMANVRIWNRTLPPKEIYANRYLQDARDDGTLIAHWKLDNTNLQDSGPNGFHGAAQDGLSSQAFNAWSGLNLQTHDYEPKWNAQASLSLLPDNFATNHIKDVPLKIGACEPENSKRSLGLGQNTFLNGYVDAVRVWNNARSAAEISTYWNQKLTGNEPALQGYWKFDEGSGERVLDGTTQNNHGDFGGTNQLSDVRIWKVARTSAEINGNKDRAIPKSADPDKLLLSWMAGDDQELPSFRGTEEIDLSVKNDDAFTIETRVNIQSIRMSGHSHYILSKKGVWLLELVASESGKLYFRFSYNYQNRPDKTPWHFIGLEGSSVNINGLSWVHVAVVGSRATHELSLYVNGVCVYREDPIQHYPYEFVVNREPIFIGGEGKPTWRKSNLLLMDGLKFDGKNDYVQIPEIDTDFSQGFTVEAWVCYESFKNWSRIIDFGLGENNQNILFANPGTTQNLCIWSVGSSVTAENVLEKGKWIHLAATIDKKGIARIYKNGVEVASGTVKLPQSLKRTSNYIGRSNWSQDGYFHGKMDEVRVWNVVRDAEQIKTYMRRMVPTYHSKLVVLWRFKEGSGILAYDNSNQRNHGLLGNGTAAHVPQWLVPEVPVRTGLTFDGSNDYVQIPELDIDFSNGFTVEAWVYYENFNYWSRIIDFGLGQNNQNILFANPGTTQNLCIWSVGSALTAENVLEKGKWIHVAATIDKQGNAKIYKNGVKVADGSVTLPANIKRTSNYIGRSNWSNDAYFYGKLDEVRLWNTARSAKQILANMHGELDAQSAGLAVYWRMSEDRGKYIKDSTSNQNHGVLGNGQSNSMPVWTEYPNIRFDGFLFDGKGSYVEIPNSSSLDLVTDFSISAWIKPNQFNGLQGILTKVTDIHTCQYALSMEGDTLRFDYEKDGNNYSLAGGEIKEGWNHVAVTIKTQQETIREVETNPNGTVVTKTVTVEGQTATETCLRERLVNHPKIKLYVNGFLVHSGKALIETEKSAAAVQIGAWGGEIQDNVFHGYIDSAVVWNEALSQKSIQQKMQQRVNSASTTIAGNWRLSEDSPYRIQDLSGKNNHGTLNYYEKFGDSPNRIERAALECNGQNSYGRARSLPALGQFTLEYWVMHKPGADGHYDRISSLNSDQFETAKNGEGRLAFHGGGLGFGWINTTYNLVQDKWTHLAFVYDGKSLKIYADGEFVHEQPATGIVSANDWYFGGRFNQVEFATINLAEVRLFDHVRSRKQILEYRGRVLRGTETGLVGYWPLTESGEDRSHGRRNMEVHNADYLAKSGLNLMVPADKGQVTLDLNGADNYISVDFNEPETNITRELWIKTNNPNCGIFSVVKDDFGSGGHDRHLYLQNGDLYARIYDHEVINTSGLKLNDGRWHHIAHVFGTAASGQKLYVDGIERARGTKNSSDFNWQDKINIGYSADAQGKYFQGQIAEVRIWNKVRTAEEIAANMDTVLVSSTEPNLIGYWRMDVGYGQQIENLSSYPGANTKPGVLRGTPRWITQSKLALEGGLFVQDDDANAIEFDGTDDCVDCGDQNLSITSAVTVSAWIYPTEDKVPLINQGFNFTGSEYGWALTLGQVIGSNPLSINWSSSNNTGNFNGSVVVQTPANSITLNTWQHVAVSKSGKTVKIYINGEEKASGALQNSPITYSGRAKRLYLGYSEEIDYVHRKFAGKMAHVSLWNKALTQEQIEDYRFRALLGSEAGLVGYLPFPELRGNTTANQTAKVFNATLQGNLSWHSKTGITLKPAVACLSFDGNNDYVEVSDRSSLQWSGRVTVEAWVCPVAGASSYNCVISKMTGGNHGFWLNMNSNYTMRWLVGRKSGGTNGVDYIDINASKVLPQNQWSHVAAAYDGTKAKLYINGKLEAQADYVGGMDTNQGLPLTVGTSSYEKANDSFCGKLADVRIWNTARTSEEIKTYRTYRFRGSEKGLIAYWPLSEASADFAKDLTTNRQHGAIHGAKRVSLAEEPLEFNEAAVVKLPPSLRSGNLENAGHASRLRRLPSVSIKKLQNPEDNLAKPAAPQKINRKIAFGNQKQVAAAKIKSAGQTDLASIKADLDKYTQLPDDVKVKLQGLLVKYEDNFSKGTLTVSLDLFSDYFDAKPVFSYINSQTMTLGDFKCHLLFPEDEEDEEPEGPINTNAADVLPKPDYSKEKPIGIHVEGSVTLSVLDNKKVTLSLDVTREETPPEEGSGVQQPTVNWTYNFKIEPDEGFGLGSVPGLKEIPIVRDINFYKPTWDDSDKEDSDKSRLSALSGEEDAEGSIAYQEKAIEDKEDELESAEEDDKDDLQTELDDLNEELSEMQEEFKALNSKKLLAVVIANDAEEDTKVVPGINVFGAMKFGSKHSADLTFIKTVFGVSELQFYAMTRTNAEDPPKREYLIELQSTIDLSKAQHPVFKLVNFLFGVDSMDLSVSVTNIQPEADEPEKPSEEIAKDTTAEPSTVANTAQVANVYAVEASTKVQLQSANHPILKLVYTVFGITDIDLEVSGTRHGDDWELEAEASTVVDFAKSDNILLKVVRDIFGIQMFKLLVNASQNSDGERSVSAEAEATTSIKHSKNPVAVFLKNLFGIDDISMELSVIFEQENGGSPEFAVQAVTTVVLTDSTNVFFKELHNFFGVKKVVVTLEITQNTFELNISLDLDKQLCDAVKLVNLAVEIAMQVTPPEARIDLITGFEVVAGSDKLKLTGRLGVELSSTAVTFKGSATMQGNWRNPFDINGVVISDLALQVGVDPTKPPVFVTELGLAGRLAIGKAYAQLAVYVNLTSPNESAVIAKAGNVQIHDIINTLTGSDNTLPKELVEISKEIIIKTFEVSIVPGPLSEPLMIGELEFDEEGITAECDLSLWDWGAFAYFRIDYDEGITACAAIDEIDIGGVFKITRPEVASLPKKLPIPEKLLSKIGDKSGPYFYLHLSPDVPEVVLAAKLELLGISRSLYIAFIDGQMEFTITDKILDLFQATLTVKAPSDLTSLYIKAEMKNDLFAEMRKVALAAIRDVANKATAKIDNARREVERLYGLIEAMRRQIRAEREALVASLRAAQNKLNGASSKVDSLLGEIRRTENHWNSLPAFSPTKESKATAWVYIGPKLAGLYAAYGVAKGVLALASAALGVAKAAIVNWPIDLDPRIIALFAVYETAKAVLAAAKVAVGAAAELASVMTRMALGEFFDVRYAMFELDYSGQVSQSKQKFNVKMRATIVFLGNTYTPEFNVDLLALTDGVGTMIENLVDEVL